MGAGWVAGVTRAEAMASSRAGPTTARRLATAANLSDALRLLSATPYRRGLDVSAGIEKAQRAVTEALVWQLRVLAGWQPRSGSAAVRLLASGFEIANTRGRMRSLSGASAPPPYRLGALSTAWPRLSGAPSRAGVRAALAASLWGDPGDESPAAVVTGMRWSAAARTAANLPPATRWAAGEAALLWVREVFLAGRPPPPPVVRHASRLLGAAAVDAASFTEFRAGLSPTARWVLEGVERPGELWRAEARWWTTVERDGLRLLRDARFAVSPVVGAVAVLCVDAWRVRAGLQCAAQGGRALEAFDELLG
ncbi:hypothetical protein [Streptomyces sp. NPDC005799]|uniref:hypothetical protein n=1 Tax=Streptomyces sp. NPDC005799 TaxID=3154678 RepID=UPI0033F3C72C